MEKYLVVIKDKYVRAEIADNDYISDYECDVIVPGKYEWYFTEGEFVIGEFSAYTENEALVCAAESYAIDIRGIKAYKLA